MTKRKLVLIIISIFSFAFFNVANEAQAAGRWMGVGDSAADVGYSDDGVIWSNASTAPSFGTGTGVVKVGDRWLAIGDGAGADVSYSDDDGLSWADVGNVFSGSPNAIATDGSRLVAVGAGVDKVLYSDDQGLTWIPAGGDIFSTQGLSVEYFGSRWVASGYGGANTIIYSDDGITWVGAGDPFGVPFVGGGYGFAYDGSRWVSVGKGDNFDIIYSDDNGLTWNGAYSLSNGGYQAYEVAWGGGRFVAVSNDDNSTVYSDDGITWVTNGNPFGGGLGASYGYSIYYGDGKFVAGGEYGTDVILTSVDGISWSGTGDTTFNYVRDIYFRAAPTYTLTYTSGSNGSIIGASPQTVTSGTDGSSVTVVPGLGYRFVGWSDASTTNPRTDTNVTGDVTVTASFELIPVAAPLNIGGGNGPILLEELYNLGIPSAPKPRAQTIYPDGTIVYQEEAATTTAVLVSKYKFNNNLKKGMKAEDIKELQKLLNANGFIVSQVGLGSMGNETTYFGSATKRALMSFQKAKNINPPQGYFGVVTRGVVNGL